MTCVASSLRDRPSYQTTMSEDGIEREDQKY